jgi:hypothetical protein
MDRPVRRKDWLGARRVCLAARVVLARRALIERLPLQILKASARRLNRPSRAPTLDADPVGGPETTGGVAPRFALAS